MSNSKKYFWLKLKDDFFRSREIKKLRNIAGGDTYTIIYLKIQLLSIKKEGVISYEGTEENLAEQLALELDEDVENVKVTLAYLERNKLMEQISEDDYLLNKVVECVGSETKAAERMRKLRAKSNNVTPQLPDVQNSYTEIEIETELEIELEQQQEENEESEKIKTVVVVLENKVSEQEAKAILRAAGGNIDTIKAKYEIAKVSNYTGFVGFMIKAIENDYPMPTKQEDKPKFKVNTKFHNFEQRTSKYTPEQLNEMVLNKRKEIMKC